jgi:biopolymer transport protein ExbD
MIRIILIFLIVFLVVRLFVTYGSVGTGEKKATNPDNKNTKPPKGVPKGLGEYVDYEEVDK